MSFENKRSFLKIYMSSEIRLHARQNKMEESEGLAAL